MVHILDETFEYAMHVLLGLFMALTHCLAGFCGRTTACRIRLWQGNVLSGFSRLVDVAQDARQFPCGLQPIPVRVRSWSTCPINARRD
jgi:hypothetical protein